MAYVVRTLMFFSTLSVATVIQAQQVRSIAQGQGSSVTAQGQTPAARRVSISLGNVTLREAIAEISREAGITIGFSAVDVGKVRSVVSTNVKNVTVVDALRAVLAGTGLQVRVSTQGEVDVVRGKAPRGELAQGAIAGKITDSKSGKGISGATISMDNDTRGVLSDESGSYRIAGISSGPHMVSVRLVGYAKQTRAIVVGDGATATVDFKLEPSASVLNEVVVTGTVVQTELKAVPNAITVITAKQIEERGITRIDQLFRGDVPGLFSLNLGSFTALDEVTMFSRGATALSSNSAGIDPNTNNTNPIKTYVDGVEMSNSKYLSQLDPGSIERIEILTGPQASTIYGSNAINGVMQIFTKRGISNRPQFTLGLNSGATENNFSNAAATNHLIDGRITGADGRWGYNVGSSWNYIGSWSPGKQTQRLSSDGGSRIDMGKVSADVSARQGLTTNKTNGRIAQSITDLRVLGIWSPSASEGIPIPETRTLTGITYGLTFSYHPFSWWSHEVVVGSDASKTEAMRTSAGFGTGSGSDTVLSINVTTAVRRSERYSGTLQLSVFNLAKLNLTLGADHWRTSGSIWQTFPVALTGSFFSAQSASGTRNKPFKNTGAFVQGQLGIGEALFLTYGLRTDWNPNFGDDAKVLPGRYGVSYTRDLNTHLGQVSTKIRGSYGRSIRPPAAGITKGVAETTPSFIPQFGNYDFIKANPDLGPEHQQGGEGGIELYFGSKGSLIVTRFNQTVDNLIDQVFRVDSVRSLYPVFPSTANCGRNPSLTAFVFDEQGYCFQYQRQYINIGSIRNQGWELQNSINIGPFTTRGTYSWVKSRVSGITPRYRQLVTGTQFQPGRPFDYIPEHIWALSVAYTQVHSTVAISINGVGMRYIAQGDLELAASQSNRFQINRPRMQDMFEIYRPLGRGYATADLNATHRFSSGMDALLQIINLTDYYQNDLNAQYASAGRSSRIGLRFRW